MPYLNERNGSGRLFMEWRLKKGWTDRGVMESELNLLGHGYNQGTVSNGELGKSFFQKGFLDWLLENKHMSQDVYDQIMAELKEDRIYQWEKKNGPITPPEPSNKLVSEPEVAVVEVVEPEPVVTPPPVVTQPVIQPPVVVPVKPSPGKPPVTRKKRVPWRGTLILLGLAALVLFVIGFANINIQSSNTVAVFWLVGILAWILIGIRLIWIWLRWLKAR